MLGVVLPMRVEEPRSVDLKDDVGSGDATLAVEACEEDGAQKQEELARGLDTHGSRCGNTQTPKDPDWRILVSNPGISGLPKYRPGIL